MMKAFCLSGFAISWVIYARATIQLYQCFWPQKITHIKRYGAVIYLTIFWWFALPLMVSNLAVLLKEDDDE